MTNGRRRSTRAYDGAAPSLGSGLFSVYSKINDPYQFRSQHDRDVGKHLAPGTWYTFDNGFIKLEVIKKALKDQYGFEEADLWLPHPEKSIKLYITEGAGNCSMGRLLMKVSKISSEILTKISEIAGFTPCEEIELSEARVKLTVGSISGKYNQELTFDVLCLRLQLCKYYCRSNSSSNRLGFAPMEDSSINGIMSLQSIALHSKSVCCVVFRPFPKLLTLSPGLLNKFLIDGHAHLPLMEIAIGKFPELPELPREILMDIFARL